MAIQDNDDLTEAQRRYIMAMKPSNPLTPMTVFSHIVGLSTVWALYGVFSNPEAGDHVKNLAAFGVLLVIAIQFLSCCFLLLMVCFVSDEANWQEARKMAAAFRGEWQVRANTVVGFAEDILFLILAVAVGYFWLPPIMLTLMGLAQILLTFVQIGVLKAVKDYDPEAIDLPTERNGTPAPASNIWRSN